MNEQAKTIKKLFIEAEIQGKDIAGKTGFTEPHISYVVNFKRVVGAGVDEIRKAIHRELKRKLKETCPPYNELWGNGKNGAVNE